MRGYLLTWRNPRNACSETVFGTRHFAFLIIPSHPLARWTRDGVGSEVHSAAMTSSMVIGRSPQTRPYRHRAVDAESVPIVDEILISFVFGQCQAPAPVTTLGDRTRARIRAKPGPNLLALQ